MEQLEQANRHFQDISINNARAISRTFELMVEAGWSARSITTAQEDIRQCCYAVSQSKFGLVADAEKHYNKIAAICAGNSVVFSACQSVINLFK